MTSGSYRIDIPTAGCETLVDVLRYRAEADGAQVVYRFLPDDGDRAMLLTFAELDARARAIAVQMLEVARPGDRAILLYHPGLDYIAAYFACIYAGIIAVPAYPPHPRRPDPRVRGIIADSGASVGLTTATLFSRLDKWRGDDESLSHLKWVATDGVTGGAEAWQRPSVDATSIAMLQYTSGSTSAPKGVMLTHGNLLNNLRMVHQSFESRPDDIGVFWLPPFHDMGLIGGILGPCYTGVSVVLMPPAKFLHRPLAWLATISELRATTSGAPNFAYDLCVDRITAEERSKLDLSCWRTAFNGAEPVRADTLERFARTFADVGFRKEAFFPCYGLAEATLFVSGGPASEPPHELRVSRSALQQDRITTPASDADAIRLVSSGRRAPDLELRVVHPARCEALDDGAVGEIWVRGASVASGYWGRTADDEKSFGATLGGGEAGFLRTGDLGALVGGRLLVTGRLKDLIVLDGRNYYPQDLELVAERSHPNLLAGHAVAFTIDEDRREQLVLLLEVTRRHDAADDWQVMTAVRLAVAEHCGVLADRIALLRQNGLPRTSSGKVQRRATRAAYLAGLLDIAAESTGTSPAEAHHNGNASRALSFGRDDVIAWIRRWAAEELQLPADSVAIDRSLRDYGVDSLMAVRFVVAVETELGLRIDTAVLWQAPSIAALAEELTTGARGRQPAPRLTREATNGFPEFAALRARFDELDAHGLRNPYFIAHEGRTGATARVGDRELINFANYNYLGLNGHPEVSAAAQEAIARYGTSVSASRVVSGERPIHRELEQELASFIGTEDATVFVGGHATNVTTISHLLADGDLVCCDELVHNSAAQGAQFSGARVLHFPHNDWRALDRLLGAVRGSYRRALIVIEGVYSADGDIPDLIGFVDVKTRHAALLMVDEAHSLGVLGATGKGISEHFGVEASAVDLWMGTLSKSLASCGGYIAGRRELTEYLRYTAPGFVFSVGMTPPNAAAALAALRVLRREPDRVRRLQQNGRRFLELSKAAGIDTGTSGGTPVVPAIIGDSMQAVRLSQLLFDRGVNVQPMVAPSVANDKARLRFFLSAGHTDAQIDAAIAALQDAVGEHSTLDTRGLQFVTS